ncbi:hypothetical protein TWF694_003044 [Orbilia ellipsospora]|uniref:Uncharacterized protein n=1 Tax=Orbilia ellipsospora TaxID=2528407 RepID=A0AAV9X1B2_9PEZI
MPRPEVETKSTESLVKLGELLNLHPDAMDNLIASIQYLLSLNSPSISLLVNCFISSRHNERKIKALQQWLHSQKQPSTISLLESILKYCISDAWSNNEALPYAPLSLRGDIPPQSESHNFHRALDIARRCDPDYSELRSTYDQLATSVDNGEWGRWLDGLIGTLADHDLQDIQASLMKIYNEREYADIPMVYIRITYLLAANGVTASMPTLQYHSESTVMVLDGYFDRIIARKLEMCYGSQFKHIEQAKSRPYSETDRKLISILASRQTDWDAVYRNLKMSTVTGMAQRSA